MQNCFQKAFRSAIICGKCRRKGHKAEDSFARKAAEKVNFFDDETFEDVQDEFSFFINTGFGAEQDPIFVIQGVATT